MKKNFKKKGDVSTIFYLLVIIVLFVFLFSFLQYTFTISKEDISMSVEVKDNVFYVNNVSPLYFNYWYFTDFFVNGAENYEISIILKPSEENDFRLLLSGQTTWFSFLPDMDVTSYFHIYYDDNKFSFSPLSKPRNFLYLLADLFDYNINSISFYTKPNEDLSYFDLVVTNLDNNTEIVIPLIRFLEFE